MTGGRVDARTDAAIEVIGATKEIVVTGEVTGEIGATEVATGAAGALSATDMVLTAGIMPGMRRSAVRSSFPKC